MLDLLSELDDDDDVVVVFAFVAVLALGALEEAGNLDFGGSGNVLYLLLGGLALAFPMIREMTDFWDDEEEEEEVDEEEVAVVVVVDPLFFNASSLGSLVSFVESVMETLPWSLEELLLIDGKIVLLGLVEADLATSLEEEDDFSVEPVALALVLVSSPIPIPGAGRLDELSAVELSSLSWSICSFFSDNISSPLLSVSEGEGEEAEEDEEEEEEEIRDDRENDPLEGSLRFDNMMSHCLLFPV